MILSHSVAYILPCAQRVETTMIIRKFAQAVTQGMSFRKTNASLTRVNAPHQMDLNALFLFAFMKLLTSQVATIVTVAQGGTN